MVKRKRTCYLCCSVDDTLKSFPANSREIVQRQWLARLGMEKAETEEKLADYRQKIDNGVDIRWCSKHFDSPLGLPIDLRSNPVLPIGELRAELQPQRLLNRYRNPIVCTTPVVSDNDMEIDEDGLDTPPPRSPARMPSPPRSNFDDYHQDELYNESVAILPKKFKSMSSIRSEATIDKGSEYVQSQETITESDELSDESSEDSERDEKKKKKKKDSKGKSEIKYRIVGESQLRALFRKCQECGEEIDQKKVEMREEGSATIVDYQCQLCGPMTWGSQERIGKGRSTVFKANQEISIGAFVTGVPIPRLVEFAKLLGIKLPSERTMRRMIKEIACPAIDRVFDRWQNQVRSLAKDAAEPNGISVSLDGQYDHPGFNAPNCKVTLIDTKLKVALAVSCVNKKEKGIDGVSIRMESVGALRAMKELINDGFTIKTRVSDRNQMVDKKLREDPATASIEALNDWWHTQKPLKKKWWTAMKSSPVIADLYCSFFNHLYWCHKKYTEKKDRPKALELVRSFLMHVQGKHSWKKGGKFSFVFKCNHEKLKRRKKGEPARPTLKPDSEEYAMIEEMLYSKNFEKAFLNSSSLIDTALNECYHSLSLLYTPKRFACSAFYYAIKTKLSVLHYNSLILHEMTGQRGEKRAFALPRPGRVAIAVKTKREPGIHPWREEILSEGVVVREDIEEGRLMERLGMPEDDVFEELWAWQEARDRGEEEDEGLDGEDEQYGEEEEEGSERSMQL